MVSEPIGLDFKTLLMQYKKKRFGFLHQTHAKDYNSLDMRGILNTKILNILFPSVETFV
jgi:hypothetical protein